MHFKVYHSLHITIVDIGGAKTLAAKRIDPVRGCILGRRWTEVIGGGLCLLDGTFREIPVAQTSNPFN
jgi:hypothetical protein